MSTSEQPEREQERPHHAGRGRYEVRRRSRHVPSTPEHHARQVMTYLHCRIRTRIHTQRVGLQTQS